jgi:hypothetical protein
MAQRVNAKMLRLGYNFLWNADWFSKKNQNVLTFEDEKISKFLKNIFEKRGFFFKKCIIKRNSRASYIFAEICGNPNFTYSIPKKKRKYKRFHNILFIKNLLTFIKKIIPGKVYISIINLFLINRLYKAFVHRLKSHFYKYKRFRFVPQIINIFNISLRTKSADFFCRALSLELKFIEKKKKNKKVWKFVSFIKHLVVFVKVQTTSIHGLKVQISGRFKGANRSKTIIAKQGMIPFNTLRADIDYAYAPTITINGSYGIKVWFCYRSKI